MCGLVGVVGTIDAVDNKIFKDLLRVDVLRGPHSTGICARTRMEQPKILKKALLPDDLLSLKKAEDLFNEFSRNDILMGHNRWATMGGINHINAHPFERETIIGAHNGTLKRQSLLPDHMDFDVDSENIFHSFEKIGVKETVKLLYGAFALTWFDRNTNIMNFTRNDERSLYYCFSAKGRTFYYASEAWMLEGVLGRHRVQHQGIMQFDPLWHYSLRISDQGQPFDKDSFKMSRLEEYKPPKQSSRSHWKKQMSTGKSDGNVKDITKKMNRSVSGKTGGTSNDTRPYENGNDVFFCIKADPPGANYLVGRDVSSTERKIHIYLPRGSVLRKKLLGSPSDQWWTGVVNSYAKGGEIIVQANSVRDYEGFCAEKGRLDEHYRESLALGDNDDPDWERHVSMIAAVGRCSWCDEVLSPTDDNHIENAHTIVCQQCKNLDEVKEVYPSANSKLECPF